MTQSELNHALAWCTSALSSVEVISDHSKEHGGHESSTRRLKTPEGYAYLKVHKSPSHWHNEVHAYEKWAFAFGDYAPTLLAVKDNAPLALIVSECPGHIVENVPLSPSQERAVWQKAGVALLALHNWKTGTHFGPCLRDGTYPEEPTSDAVEYISKRFKNQIDRAIQGNYIHDAELATLRAASDMIPAFKGERPIPCHRDYCSANWLINEEGVWTGVIDFEFSYWDVRVADFSRDPHWSWINRPDLIEAFFTGYGRSLTTTEEQQLLVAYAEYALSAILWGRDHAFYGFEKEGRESLKHLATQLKQTH